MKGEGLERYPKPLNPGGDHGKSGISGGESQLDLWANGWDKWKGEQGRERWET